MKIAVGVGSLALVSLLCVGINAEAELGPSSGVISLSGDDWLVRPERPAAATAKNEIVEAATAKGWLSATVPGNIQADVEAAQLVKPLWYGMGDPLLPKIAQADWTYKQTFLVPESFRGKRLTLVFDGVDQHCVVTLNGTELGAHAGMFDRFQFDVSDVVRFGRGNELSVRVLGIPADLAAIVERGNDKDGAGVIRPAYAAVLQRYKELKSAINHAYDWGVVIYTLGIWKDVRLEASGPARIEWVQINTQLQNDYSQALIRARVELDSLEATQADISLELSGHRVNVSKTIAAQVDKGANVVEAELSLDDPELWWPNGDGEQALYELVVSVVEPGTGTVLQSKKTRFGVRELRWELTEGAPQDFPNRFNLILNGRPIRMRGSNIVPPDLLFGRIGDNGLRLIRLAAEAGFNKLRVWGGGIILPKAMYDLADELGIMLFQEYPLANYVPEPNAEFLVNLEDTAVNIVKQLRNHPSIIEWSGGNEMPWPDPHHPALEILRRVTAQHDDRVFRDTCAIAGEGSHWPYIFHPKENPPSGWGFGGVNFYQGWNAHVGMRFGEFASNSPANLEVWQREILPESKWPINDTENPILIRKNVYHAAGGDSWLHKNHTEKYFGSFESIEDLVEAGQFFGAEGLRYAMDELRRRGKRVGGFTSWNYNEPWPNGAGSYMIDYDGRPLMNYDFVKQALAPIAISIRQDRMFFDPDSGFECSLWLVSDAPATVSDLHWSWKARDWRGKVFARNEGTAAIDPIEVKALETLQIQVPQDAARGPIFLELQLRDGEGGLLTERIHVFGPNGVGTPLRGLLDNRGEEPEDYDPTENERKNLAPVEARFVRATVEPVGACIDEFEVYAPSSQTVAPNVAFSDHGRTIWRPVLRTRLELVASAARVEDGREVLELTLENKGEMTALRNRSRMRKRRRCSVASRRPPTCLGWWMPDARYGSSSKRIEGRAVRRQN